MNVYGTDGLLLSIVTLLVSAFWTPVVEAKPLVRARRATVAQLIDLTRLSNPCRASSTSLGNAQPVCDDDQAINLSAGRAKAAVISLQDKLSLDGICSGMDPDMTIPTPTITSQMTRVNKLAEIYKSLVHHAAILEAIRSLQTERSLQTDYNRTVTSLQNTQCSLLCNLNLSAADLSGIVTSASSPNFPDGQNTSSLAIRSCFVTRSVLPVLNSLITLTQTPT